MSQQRNDVRQLHWTVQTDRQKALYDPDWTRAQRFLEHGERCEALVTRINRGGVEVQFGHLRGFVPNSHLISVPRGIRGHRWRQAKSELIGQILSLAVIEVERQQRRLVLSERDTDSINRRQLFEQLTPGETRNGVVRHIVDYGAFVDLGGVDGLLHVSELDWHYVTHPNKVLSEGDQIQVFVLSVDKKRQRIRLSRKRLLPDPWPVVSKRLREGQVVRGTVTRTTRYGLFVDIGEGIEGLARIPEASDDMGSRTSPTSGTMVSVRVLSIDDRRRRISLRLQETGPAKLLSARSPWWQRVWDWVSGWFGIVKTA
jgi:small subunit ribosomal protein S1